MVVVIMGVAGAGKTTVGMSLARSMQAQFLDADDVHPESNVEKMRDGVPLTEADRAPWLQSLREHIDGWLDSDTTAVLACSALTQASRERLGTDRPGVELVFLDAPMAVLSERMRGRRHFMPESLLASQFATLERPAKALVVDATLPVASIVEILGRSLP